MKNPVVTIEMMNGDIIKAELYPEVAPNTDVYKRQARSWRIPLIPTSVLSGTSSH